jgi:hypothetical protein
MYSKQMGKTVPQKGTQIGLARSLIPYKSKDKQKRKETESTEVPSDAPLIHPKVH